MNRIFKDPFALLTLAIAFFLLSHSILGWFEENPQAQLQAAQNAYNEGVNTNAQDVRKEQFNASLKSLLSLEKKYDPSMGNGKLYANIGTLFFQLQEFPMAILYYYRAKALNPRDENIKVNLIAAQNKAHITPEEPPSPTQRLLFFHYDYSLPERLQIFTLLFAASLATGSFYIWFHNYWLEKLSTLLLFAAMLFLCSLAISYYFSEAQGILIKPSLIYRGAGKQFATLSETSEKAGNKVVILENSFDKSWIKIQTADGTIGYIPGEAIQTI